MLQIATKQNWKMFSKTFVGVSRSLIFDFTHREKLRKTNIWVFSTILKKSWIFLADIVILQASSLKTVEIVSKMWFLYQRYNSNNQLNPKSGFERPSQRFWSIFFSNLFHNTLKQILVYNVHKLSLVNTNLPFITCFQFKQWKIAF